MKNRSEVKQELLNRLGSTWNSVKDSLLGNELLSLGVEAVMYAEECNEAVKSAFDTETASKEMLIAMSHVYHVPISFVRPATVTIKISGGGYYAPYTLCLSKGNVTYYNIDYVNASEEVTLYQGNIMRLQSPSAIVIPTDTLYDKVGYVVGETIPQSIYVTYDYPLYVSRFDAMSINDNQFRLYTLSDGRLFVEYGKSVEEIKYLEPTSAVTNIDGALLNTNQTYSVLATTPYENDSIDVARDYFRKFYYEMNAVVSKSQIHDYVNTFSTVLDCNVVPSTNSQINIYIKPKDRNQVISTFGNIESALDEHGMFGIFHNVTLGTPFKIKLICNNIPIDKIAYVSTLLTDSFKYEDTSFNATLTPYALSSMLRTKTGITSDIRIFVDAESVTDGEHLRFKALRGTLKILQETNDGYVSIGYDNNGYLYIQDYESSSTTSLINLYGHFGDICVVGNDPSYPLEYFNLQLNTVTYCEGSPTLHGAYGTNVRTFGDYIYEGSDGNTYVYLRADATYQKVMLNEVFSLNEQAYLVDDWLCALYLNGTLCTYEDDGSKLTFKFYHENSPAFFTKQTTVPNTATVLGNVFFENSWYIFIHDGGVDKCVVYENIRTSMELITIQQIDFGVENVRFIGSNGDGDIVVVGTETSPTTGMTVLHGYGLSIQYGNVVTSEQYRVTIDNGSYTSTTSFTQFYRGSNFIEFKDGTLYAQRIYDTDDFIVEMSDFKSVFPQDSPVGRIDYDTSKIYLNRTDIIVSYEASEINETNESEYIVLDSDEPILFD